MSRGVYDPTDPIAMERLQNLNPYQLIKEITKTKTCIKEAEEDMADTLYWEDVMVHEQKELDSRPEQEIAEAYARVLREELTR